MERGDLVGSVVIHSADTIQYANEAFNELVGVDTSAELTGQPFAQFVADPYRERLTEHFERLLDDNGPVYGDRAESRGASHAPASSAPVSASRRISASAFDSGSLALPQCGDWTHAGHPSAHEQPRIIRRVRARSVPISS
jgi:PAS domain S-box-containing protein